MKTEKKNNNYINDSREYYLKFINNMHKQRNNRESIKTYRNSSFNNKIINSSKAIPHSIKPFYCSIPKDINLHEIFINMMNSSFKINGNKSIYTKMDQEDLEIRNYILNKIKIFLEKNEIQKKILCSIIFLYDILVIKNKKEKLFNDFEEIGLGATYITMKFLYTKKKSFYSKKNFSDIFQNDNFALKNINEIEIKCLKLIDYFLNYASPISFMEIIFINGIIFSNDKIKEGDSGQIYDLVIEIIEKIMLISNEYIKYNPLCLCSSIVSFAREIYNLESWPQILTQAFGVTFCSFKNIYEEFHEFIIPKTKNEKTKINNKIEEDKNEKEEMKLHTCLSVVQNNINTYRHRNPIKVENENNKKYINIYYNHNYKLNKNNNQMLNINNNCSSEVFLKYKKKNKFLNKKNIYENDITEENAKEKKIKEMEIEIPSLNNNKNNSFGNIYENKLNETEENNIKSNKRVFYKNKEDDYSNVATSENSNNYNKSNLKKKYKKNYIISYDNKKYNIKNLYKDEHVGNKVDAKKQSLYENSGVAKTSQKDNDYPRWSSIKKFYKLKQNLSKESNYPLTESKLIYYKKKYK